MAAKIIQSSDAWGGALSLLGHQMTLAGEKEAASILTTANRHTNWLDSPQMVANTTTSSFDPRDLCSGKMTIYLVLHPKYQTSHAAWLRLLIDAFMRVVISHGLSNRKVHFVLDEAASLGHMDQIESALDKYRGYGIRLIFFYQSIGQLKKCWPEGQEQTLLGNVSQCFYGVNDPQTAEYIASRLGTWTQVTSSGGTNWSGSVSHSTGSGGGSTSSSRSWGGSSGWQQAPRKLLNSDEIMNLDPRVAITFTQGCYPIVSYLTRYYEPPPRTRIGLVRVVIDTLCLFLCAVILAVMATAILLPSLLRSINVKGF